MHIQVICRLAIQVIFWLFAKRNLHRVRKQLLQQEWSVRETEKRVRQILGKLPQAGIKKSLEGSSEEKKQMLLNLEEDLQRQLGTRVGIRHSGKKGEIRIHFQNLDEFDRLFSLLKSR